MPNVRAVDEAKIYLTKKLVKNCECRIGRYQPQESHY